AVLDEYNQLYYNRGSSLNDVLIDLSGAVFGVGFFLLGLLLFSLIKRLVVLRSEKKKLSDGSTTPIRR
ncbi:MAG: hypothetical protein WBJ29_07945, partial [Fervidobacterium sp.]